MPLPLPTSKAYAQWIDIHLQSKDKTPYSEPGRFSIDNTLRSDNQGSFTFIEKSGNEHAFLVGHYRKEKGHLDIKGITIPLFLNYKKLVVVSDCIAWTSQLTLEHIIEQLELELSKESFDYCELLYLRLENSTIRDQLTDELTRKGLHFSIEENIPIIRSYIKKEHSVRPSLRHGKKTQKRRQQKRKKLENELGPVTLRTYVSLSEESEFFSEIQKLEGSTWQTRKELKTFKNSPHSREVFRYEANKGRFIGFILFAGQSPLAYRTGVNYQGIYHAESTGFNAHYANLSPGDLLFTAAFDELQDMGIEWIDFGIGDFGHKKVWGTHSIKNYTIKVYSNSARSSLLRCGESFIKRNKAILKAARTLSDKTSS